MRDYHLETAFLRRMLSYDQSAQAQQIEQSIARAQRDHTCALKAIWTAGLLDILSAILSQTDFFQSGPLLCLRIICVVGLTATICLLAFLAVLVFYRLKLNSLREDSRHLIQQLMDAHVCPQDGVGRHERQNTQSADAIDGRRSRENGNVSLRPG